MDAADSEGFPPYAGDISHILEHDDTLETLEEETRSNTEKGIHEPTKHLQSKQRAKHRPDRDILRDNKQIGVPHIRMEALLCGGCGFQTPIPKTLRLHQLLACCEEFPEEVQPIDMEGDIIVMDYAERERRAALLAEEKPFGCDICPYRTKIPGDLKRHFITHMREKIYPCTSCNYRSKFSADLKRHNLIHTGEKPYSCSVCSYRCRTMGDLKSHTLIHTGQKPFSCSVPNCTYKCKRASDLKKHFLKHSGERPFTCPTCNYKCRTASNLRKHELSHTGEMPFSCDSCSFICNVVTLLNKHKRMKHSGDLPFECKIIGCRLKFRTPSELTKHSYTHSTEITLNCSKCSYKCNQLALFKKHTLRHTAEQSMELRKPQIQGDN